MRYYYYAEIFQCLQLAMKEDLQHMVASGQLNMDSLVLPENGVTWQLVSSALEQVEIPEAAKTPDFQAFTVEYSNGLKIKNLPIKRTTPQAAMLEGYQPMPDGTMRQVLIFKEGELPTVPEIALNQYVLAQEKRVDQAMEALKAEKKQLEECKKLLNEMLKEKGIL
jgi:hypothetical protein